jgi:hypothetical protein
LEERELILLPLTLLISRRSRLLTIPIGVRGADKQGQSFEQVHLGLFSDIALLFLQWTRE